jgi:hypothetical protein
MGSAGFPYCLQNLQKKLPPETPGTFSLPRGPSRTPPLPHRYVGFGGHPDSLAAGARRRFGGTPPPKFSPLVFWKIFQNFSKGIPVDHPTFFVSRFSGVEIFVGGQKGENKKVSRHFKKNEVTMGPETSGSKLEISSKSGYTSRYMDILRKFAPFDFCGGSKSKRCSAPILHLGPPSEFRRSPGNDQASLVRSGTENDIPRKNRGHVRFRGVIIPKMEFESVDL